MEKLTSILIFCLFLVFLLKTDVFENRKVTKFQFYLHDILDGPNKTVWRVAQSKITESVPHFGGVVVLDDLVTSGPEIDSQRIGRLQGVVAGADFSETAIVMLLNVVFTEGEYKGSTLSILGRNPLNRALREVPVVGGTGVFRLARGYVITRTLNDDPKYLLLEYNVVVVHDNLGVFDV